MVGPVYIKFLEGVGVIYVMTKSGFWKGQKVMAPQNGRYHAVKMPGIVHQTYGEWVTVDFPHEDPMQSYRLKMHMSVVVPAKE